MTAPGANVSDEELLERFPHAQITHDNKEFFRGLLQRRLLVDRCRSCTRWHLPPRPTCPSCWSDDVQPVEVSGTGTIYLLTFVHQGPPCHGVEYARPHPVATIELSEQPGLRFTSTIIECPAAQIQIGMAVALTWIERDGNPFPAFSPVGAAR